MRSDEITAEQAWQFLDQAATKYLGIRAHEFAQEHDRGNIPDDAIYGHLTDLLNLARQGS